MKSEYAIKLSQTFPPNQAVASVTLRVRSETPLDDDQCVISDEFHPEVNAAAKAFFNPGYYEVEVFDEDGKSVEFETKVN
jgi:hypothetical protein